MSLLRQVLKVRLQAEPQLAATGELQLLRQMVRSEGCSDSEA